MREHMMRLGKELTLAIVAAIVIELVKFLVAI